MACGQTTKSLASGEGLRGLERARDGLIDGRDFGSRITLVTID